MWPRGCRFPIPGRSIKDLDEVEGSMGLLMGLVASKKALHTDFFNNFKDLVNGSDIQ
uniref:COP9 signalosome complex subunit 9 n=1 Tax=Vombatus ursinus TaxID=29139 RepID=A0A4X2LVC5_VOMUR